MNQKAPLRFCALFVLLMVTSGCFSGLAIANPYIGHTSPPVSTQPPTITLFSPNNNTIIASNNIALIFNVSTAETQNAIRITEVYFAADWLEGNTSLYSLGMTNPDYSNASIVDFFEDETLTEIPDGNHSVTLVATAQGFSRQGFGGFYFNISGYSTINFAIDTTSPSITALSVENKTYNSTRIPLNFSVDEPSSWIGYSLDNEANITLTENTILEVKAGVHHLTIYANDTAGNMGSETVEFTSRQNQPASPATPSPAPTQQSTPSSVQPEKSEDSGLVSDTVLIAFALVSVAAVVGVTVAFKIRKR